MPNNMPLQHVFRTDLYPNADQIKEQKKTQITKDKRGLMNIAKNYNERYKDEISSGTSRLDRLIEEGVANGKTIEEVKKSLAVFIPTKSTPLLNFLYYLLNEVDDERQDIQVLTEQYNRQHGHLQHDEISTQNVKETPDVHTFLYGNVTADTFVKIKKLKALSKSPNENEAFVAYRKCLEYCQLLGLEFDKIPCDVK